MADDLGVQFFTTANAQHEGVTKWHLIVLAVLAYLHLALVVPFAEQTARKAEVDRELAANRTLGDQLTPIVDSVTALETHLRADVETVTTGLRNDLVARFDVLSKTMKQLVMLGPERAAGQEGEQLFNQQQVVENVSQQMQQQQLQPEPAPAPTLETMPPELRARVAEAGQGSVPDEQYTQELAHYIDERVIAPAFAQANNAWTSDHRPNVVSEADVLQNRLQSVMPASGTASDQFGALQEQLGALSERVEKLSFTPPSDPDWWRTVASKEASIGSMIKTIQKAIDEIASKQGALETLKKEVADIIEQKKQAADQLVIELQDLDRQARELQAQLGEIGGPLKVIAVKLQVLAPLLPLIIGLAAAGFAVWKAEFLQRMRFAASLVEDGAQGRAVRGWLRSAAGGSTRRLVAKEVIVGALMIAWVLAAGRSAASLPAPFASHELIIALAVAVVAGGGAYHWHRSRQALITAGAN